MIRFTTIFLIAAIGAFAETLEEFEARVIAPNVVEVVARQEVSRLGNAIYYDVTVHVTTDDADVVSTQTQPVVKLADGTYKLSGRRVTNYVAPEHAPSAKELLYNGRQALISLRDNETPIPSSPTAELPLVVTDTSWHGRIVSGYEVRKDAHSVAGVPGSVVILRLKVEGGFDDRVSAFIWVSHNGQYIIDPHES